MESECLYLQDNSNQEDMLSIHWDPSFQICNLRRFQLDKDSLEQQHLSDSNMPYRKLSLWLILHHTMYQPGKFYSHSKTQRTRNPLWYLQDKQQIFHLCNKRLMDRAQARSALCQQHSCSQKDKVNSRHSN